MKYNASISINGREISINSPTYFIADIAANHDGDLGRAKELIWLAKKAGADAAKFQHFKAEKIVSDFGFKNLGTQVSHQASWKKSVFEIYQQYECNRDWTFELVKTCREADIEFMTTPYDYEALSALDKYVYAYKVGSGDITWIDFIGEIAKLNKPVLLATGAAAITDVERAVDRILHWNPNIALLQCNTNYTGSVENFLHVNLRVLQMYSLRYPNMVLGLSDHTPGHATVLGAVALGARIIEKHFTDDNHRIGPDHAFALNPEKWSEMVAVTRQLEMSLGTGIKKIEDNEIETVVVQRRSIRVKHDISAGEIIQDEQLECLRPAPKGAVEPYNMPKIIGKRLSCCKKSGDAIYWSDVECD